MKKHFFIGLITLLMLVFALTIVNKAQAAIGTGGATCTNQSKTAETSFTCTVATENFDAGNIAVMWFASDNIASIDGDDPLLSVTDSSGNCWTVQRCFANASGATTCIATSKITTALTSGSGTITANFPQNITAKAMIVREFTVGAGNTIAITGTPQILANDGADPGSMTIAVASAQHLFVRSTALERPTGGAWSVTNINWTTTGCNGTTGGGAASNMDICGEFRIDTSTGDTSNPGGTNVDSASVFIAFDEVAAGAPVYKAAGIALSGTAGDVSPAWPAHAVNDIALLFVETTGGNAASLSVPAGFVEVTNSPQSTGTTTNGTRLTVFWARATSAAMTAPTVTHPTNNNHIYAQILTYCGVITTGDPWDVTGGSTDTGAGGSINVTSVTTTVTNTLIVQAVTRDNDNAPGAAFSAQTNANLTNIAERSDAGTSSGNGGGFAVWDGVKATTGATGTTNVTVTDTLNAFLTIALKPPPAAGAPSKLAFLQQPSHTVCNTTITPAVTVEIQDASGTRVTTATNSVDIAIGTNPVGGNLLGTTPVNAVAGVATFSDLKINAEGNGYTLTASTASASGLTGATSSSFNILAGACAYGATQCAGSRYGSNLGCDAGDVSLPSMSIAPTTPMTSCIGGETVVADLDVTVLFKVPAKYDIGIFISNDGKDPQPTPANGGAQSCKVAILPIPPEPQAFMNLDSNGGQDTCGDGEDSLSGVLRITNVSFLCQAATGSNGNLYIPYVVSWDQSKTPPGAVCTSIANPVPGAPSKCNAPKVLLGEGVVSVVVLPVITKTDNKTTLLPNESTTYTVAISNATGVTLTNAVFTDPSVTGLTVNTVTCATTGGASCPVSCTPNCDVVAMQVAGLTIPTMPVIAAQSITGITKANPAVLTYSGIDTYANGDKIKITGVQGMTEVNDREYTVANVNTVANTFQLSGINSTDYAAYSSLGEVREISTVTFTINAAVSATPPAIINNIATVTAGTAAASASDSTGGSGSGSGGGRVKVIKWREVFQ
jgi:uncharacterized repeat protein (TIGR01451 family)